MIRSPSDRAALWAWWRATLDGQRPPTTLDPQCGFYRVRVRGLWQPCAIDIAPGEVCPETGELLGPEELVCTVDGVRRDPDEIWSYAAKHPITEANFRALEANASAISGVRDLTRSVIL